MKTRICRSSDFLLAVMAGSKKDFVPQSSLNGQKVPAREVLQLSGELPVSFVFWCQFAGAGEDFPGEVGALLTLQEAGGEVTVFGEAGGEFVGAGGALGLVARRGQRDVVVRLGEQAGEGVLREPGGIAVPTHFILHTSHAAADEIGDGDSRGGMDVVGEWISRTPKKPRQSSPARVHAAHNAPARDAVPAR